MILARMVCPGLIALLALAAPAASLAQVKAPSVRPPAVSVQPVSPAPVSPVPGRPPVAAAPPAVIRLEVGDARARSVTFGCDAPAGNVCDFIVVSVQRGVGQHFALAGGARAQVTGVIPGLDRYIVTVNQTAPLQIDCNAAPDRTRFCKVAMAGDGYNN